MRKFILSLLLIVGAMISNATDRTATIKTGLTTISPALTLTTADGISENETVNIVISNPQKYMQFQTFTTSLTNISGSTSVTVTAYGKVLSNSAYVQIGSPVTITTGAVATITATTPVNYNILKVEYVAGSGTQHSHIATFDVKTANAYDIPANSGTLTISRATSGAVVVTTKDDDANAVTNYRAGGSGALTLGSVSGTAAILSSDWAIDATGIATNMGTINGLTILNSKARLVTTAIAAADSTSAGAMLSAVDQFVVVTSGAASRSITLPATSATTIGLVIEGWVGATGFDLRVATAQAMTVKLNDVTGAATVGVEAAIPATTKFRVVCVSATEWILTATTKLGAVVTAIVPDPIEK